MRCNRLTIGFAVTPHLKVVLNVSVTEMLQLRRNDTPQYIR